MTVPLDASAQYQTFKSYLAIIAEPATTRELRFKNFLPLLLIYVQLFILYCYPCCH
jgi:hypothetical protein